MRPVRTTRPSREEVRRRLLDAAAEVLVSHGYGAASVEVIAEAAGLSRGALYSNFGDKDSLYLDLLDELEQQQINELTAIFNEHEDLDRFLDLLATRGRSSKRDARGHLILQVELWLLAMRNPAVKARMATIQRRTLNAISGAVDRTSLDLTPTEIAAVVSALGDGLLMQRMIDPKGLRPSLLVDVLRPLATLAGLLPPTGQQ